MRPDARKARGRHKNAMLVVISVALAMLLSASMLSAVQGLGPNTGTLAGTVTDADTGEPLEGATVTLEYHDITRTDLADANGQYEFKGVPICYCLKDVSASSKGYGAQTRSVGVGAYTVVDLALVPDDGGIDDATGVLTGTVTDADTGEAVVEALMTLTYHEVSRNGLSDANGVYRFEDVPVCFCLKNISASKDGYIDQSKEVGVSGVTVVDFALTIEEQEPDMGTIMGTVTDLNNGEPLEKVLIELTYHDVLRTVYTDANGRYRFDQVPECRCLKTVKASLEHVITESQDVSVHGVTVLDLALMIEEQEPPVGSLTGTVTDADTGGPIQGAKVTLEHDGITLTDHTDTDGRYIIMGVPICFCLKDVSVAKEGYEDASVSIGVGEQTVQDFALEPNGGTDGKINGRIDHGGTSAISAVQGVALIGLMVAFVAALLVAVSVRNARD